MISVETKLPRVALKLTLYRQSLVALSLSVKLAHKSDFRKHYIYPKWMLYLPQFLLLLSLVVFFFKFDAHFPNSCAYFCYVLLKLNVGIIIIIVIIISPLTARVIGAPQMISQPVSSISPCSPLPSGTWQTPGLFIPWYCLPTSSSVCLFFFPLSLCLARWFWPGLMNWRHDHTTAISVSLQLSEGLHVVQLPAGSWHGLPHW